MIYLSNEFLKPTSANYLNGVSVDNPRIPPSALNDSPRLIPDHQLAARALGHRKAADVLCFTEGQSDGGRGGEVGC
jgi:hypothetical protein